MTEHLTRERLFKWLIVIISSPISTGGFIPRNSIIGLLQSSEKEQLGWDIRKELINQGVYKMNHTFSYQVTAKITDVMLYQIVDDLKKYAESGLDLSSELEGFLRKNINDIYIGLTDEIVNDCINSSVKNTTIQYYNFLKDNDAEPSDDYYLLFEAMNMDDRQSKKDKFDLELLMCLQAHVDERKEKITIEEVNDAFKFHVTRYLKENFNG